VRYFNESNVVELDLMDNNVLKKVKALWADVAIQKTWLACKNYQIQMSQLDYIMENLDRIIQKDFVPNDEDIVRSRQRTTGAYKQTFRFKECIWEIHDVGGQVPERKKWLDIINDQDFASIIYFAALDEYNMESNETKLGKTKMEVSLNVFGDIINNKDTFKCCSILFLNKIDLFKEKILSEKGFRDFKEKYPDFLSYMKNDFKDDIKAETFMNNHISVKDANDKRYWAAIKYIEKKFKETIENEEIKKNLVVFPTCAIEKDHIEKVFEATSVYVFDLRMKLSGIKW